MGYIYIYTYIYLYLYIYIYLNIYIHIYMAKTLEARFRFWSGESRIATGRGRVDYSCNGKQNVKYYVVICHRAYNP